MAYDQPTFMLLPDFSFLPGGKLDIGKVLPQGSKNLPDPRRPFSNASLHLSPSDLEKDQEFEPWQWNSHDSFKTSAGVWADISLLTGIGAGLDGSRGHNEGLDIKCKRLVQKTYLPADEDLDKILKDDTVSRILKKLDRPSVYLVTGLMIAHEATIEIVHGRERGGGSRVKADVTSIGVPLNVGLKGEVSQSGNKTLLASPKEPFILAYQLRRLRRRLRGGYDGAIEPRWALYTDEIPISGAESFLIDFEIDRLTPVNSSLSSE